MFLQSRIVFILSLVCTSVVAMKCDKLRTIDDDAVKEDHVFNEGVYRVKTTLQSNSGEIQELVGSLKNIGNTIFSRRSFTATLQPKHIKKLCRDDRIVHIKQIERIKHEIKCNKLLKGNSSYAVQDSYIVTTNDHILSAASINSFEIASESIDSSVMIASSTPLHGSSNGFIMKMNDAAVEYICDHPLVDYIEEDQEISIASSITQWHLDRIDQESLPLDNQYAGTNDGSGVDIYIFDTGINYNHSEFDNRAKYSGMDAVDFLNDEHQNGLDCHGHGSHVAGLAGGRTHGVAKGATLYSVRVLDCRGYGSTATILVGLNYVINQVQQKQASSSKKTKAIINMSLTTRNSYLSRAMRETITKAVNNGILIVVAAGNYRTDACKYSPSSFTNVLTVGGTQRNDDLYNTFFYGTNYGSCVDIFAPGQNVRSAYHTGPNSYATLDGTSQATPLVSGAAAVYWNMLPGNPGASEVKNALLNTCSRGRLNIAASVPSPFNQNTINCLLHIQNIKQPAQKVYYNVSFDEIELLIEEMEQQNYALSYLQNHLNSANNTQYSLIFTNMKRKRFRTFVLITEINLREIEEQLSPKEFKIIFIHNLVVNNTTRFVVVFAKKAKYEYTAKLNITPKNLQDDVENMTLCSTSVVLSANQDVILQTLLYSTEIKTHALLHYNIKKRALFKRVNSQIKQGYHLKYLSSYVINDKEKYALVLHKFTKADEKYGLLHSIKSEEVQETVKELLAQGNVLNVVAGIWNPKSDNVQYLIAYEST